MNADRRTERPPQWISKVDFLLLLQNELSAAESRHRPIQSLHEGYAVILEEVDELWEQVRLKAGERSVDEILMELVQIAAMAWRTASNLGYCAPVNVAP